MIKVHGTSIEIFGKGILLRGASGSGKSDLALRLIDSGAQLVSDDYTEIHSKDDIAVLRAPCAIQGKIEVRGLGLMEMSFAKDTSLELIFDMVPFSKIERAPPTNFFSFNGLSFPVRSVDPFMASAPAIIRLAARQDILKTGYE
jgi:HPr kinase/phosphorylase